ncbi:diguanylate cyclase [Candidatus Methylospira mobilis]|uniref:Diguanylate cyclase n=1 Tax=Candidatus Methylospira mobilis TaxID=1808979 RepID=A0A5Q0BQT9_9GAMM|nr:diguanylate cyclase [Candidatus Methylospira mobilis]QFY44671.1 diguanylate cyclase [Candidatus Methylospira mobilis]WNV05792.1 diguanylate cyclase [Candidatus Methylospira mobilis]
MEFFKVLSLIIGLFLCATAVAEDLILSREVFEDPGGNLTLEQAEQASFQPMAITLSRGHSDSAFWVRLRIRRPAAGGLAVLRIDRPALDVIRLYAPDPAHPGRWTSRATGDRYPYEQRDLLAIPYEFSITPGAPDTTYYLCIKSTSSIITHIEALEPRSADMKNNRIFVIQSFYFIAMLFLLFWSCHDYAENRQPVVALFILYLATYILNSIAAFGYIPAIAPAGISQFADGIANSLLCCLIFTSLLFHQKLLALFSPPPLLMYGARLLLLLFPLELGAMMLGYTRLALQTNSTAILFAGPYLLILALFAKRQVAPGLKVLRLVYGINAVLLLFLASIALGLIKFFQADMLGFFVYMHLGHGLISSSLIFTMIHLRSRQLKREMSQSVLARHQLEQRFRMFMDVSPTIAWIKDAAGRFQYVNRTFEQRFGLTAQDLLGKTDAALWPADIAEKTRKHDLEAMTTNLVVEVEDTLRSGDNSASYWHAFRIPFQDIAGGSFLGGIAVDITARKQAEAALERSLEKLRQANIAYVNTQEGICITDFDTRIIAVNPAFSTITEYGEEDIIGQSLSLLRSDRHDREFYRRMWDDILKAGLWQGEIYGRRKGGETFPLWLSISTVHDDADKAVGFVCVLNDMTRIRHVQTPLERLAYYDALTGLANRKLLLMQLDHALDRAIRVGNQGAVLFIDLDRFKPVNDTYGHAAGDELLQRIARRLQERLRKIDTVARLGGDEFVVLLEDLPDRQAVVSLAEDLIDTLAAPFQLSGGQQVSLGCSIGISLYPQYGTDPDQLLQQADEALYQVKKSGRGAHHFYAPAA